MATMEHSIEVAVPADVASRDLGTFAYRSSIGHYRVVDGDVGWSAADDCETEGIVAFEPLESERTRMTLRVGYEPEQTPNCEPAVHARVTGELAEFKQFSEERYRAAAFEDGDRSARA